jgi:hypothetical protein
MKTPLYFRVPANKVDSVLARPESDWTVVLKCCGQIVTPIFAADSKEVMGVYPEGVQCPSCSDECFIRTFEA